MANGMPSKRVCSSDHVVVRFRVDRVKEGFGQSLRPEDRIRAINAQFRNMGKDCFLVLHTNGHPEVNSSGRRRHQAAPSTIPAIEASRAPNSRSMRAE